MNNVLAKQAYRLLFGDMLALFQIANEGVIKILGSYFKMNKLNATRSVAVYKTFCEQAVKIHAFFNISDAIANELGVHAPDIKHVINYIYCVIVASRIFAEKFRGIPPKLGRTID